MIDAYRTLAERMFAKLPAATITRSQTASFEPRTRKAIGGGTTSIACHTLLETIETKTQAGELVHHTTALLNVEPQNGDTLTVGPSTFHVASWMVEAPDGVGIYWRAVVTK